MNQVVLIGLISLSCICIFFIYQNIKLKRMYTEEFTRLNKNMNDMTRLVSLNAEKNTVLRQGNFVDPIHAQSGPAPSQNSEEESKYDKLKINYEEYVKTNFDPYEFENVSDEVKEGIENLTGEGFIEQPMYIGEEIPHVETEEEQNLEAPEVSNDTTEPNVETEEEVVGTLEELSNENIEVSGESFEGLVEEVAEDLAEEVAQETVEGLEAEGMIEETFEVEDIEDSEQQGLVNDVISGLTNFEPSVVEPTFTVNDNDNLDLDFEETGNVDLENFAKSKNDDLENMTLKELQQLARDNNVKVKGKKNELIDRLKEKLLVN